MSSLPESFLAASRPRLSRGQPGAPALLQAAIDPLVAIAMLAASVGLLGSGFDGGCLILALLVFAMTFPGSLARASAKSARIPAGSTTDFDGVGVEAGVGVATGGWTAAVGAELPPPHAKSARPEAAPIAASDRVMRRSSDQ